MQALLTPIIRHGLAAAAGALLARGFIDASMTDAFVGAGMALANLGWMVVSKRVKL